MADKVTNGRTTLVPEDVIVRAVQFFSTGQFKPTSQSGRAATFDGRARIPLFLVLLTVISFLFFVIPGVIMYFVIIRKMRRFQTLVVTASSIAGGSQVSITHPKWASKTARRFVKALPPLAESTAPLATATR